MCEASIAALSNGFQGSPHQMEKLNWALGKTENDENANWAIINVEFHDGNWNVEDNENGFHSSSHQMEELNWALGKIENDENA